MSEHLGSRWQSRLAAPDHCHQPRSPWHMYWIKALTNDADLHDQGSNLMGVGKVGKSRGRREWDPSGGPYPCYGQYCCEEEEQVPMTERSVIISGGNNRCCVRERHNNKGET